MLRAMEMRSNGGGRPYVSTHFFYDDSIIDERLAIMGPLPLYVGINWSCVRGHRSFLLGLASFGVEE